ncbi:MAG: hypothetical protein M0R74_17800 [Dehalococcoidia bacterium]|nr:hypothetical protein [Dehalococcoidia bacterium]
MVGAELGENRRWLLHSHLNGVAKTEHADTHARIDALLVYRDQLTAELQEVQAELAGLARLLQGAPSSP